MIEVRSDALVFSFPEVHHEARCTVIFQRTLRLPEDGRRYPSPPGLGRYPLSSLPRPGVWSARGKKSEAVFPVYQSEAFSIIFVGSYPFAVRVSAGGVDAITGRTIQDERLWRPRDYTVVPSFPWMEWFCVGDGPGRQFVAVPLGKEAGSGRRSAPAEVIITAHPMKAGRYREYRRRRSVMMSGVATLAEGSCPGLTSLPLDGTLASGDHYGPAAWEPSSDSACSVYPLNSLAYAGVTGRMPPGKAPTAAHYREAGLPWLEHYGADRDFLESCTGRAS